MENNIIKKIIEQGHVKHNQEDELKKALNEKAYEWAAFYFDSLDEEIQKDQDISCNDPGWFYEVGVHFGTICAGEFNNLDDENKFDKIITKHGWDFDIIKESLLNGFYGEI